MQMDAYTKLMMTIIAIALVWNGVRDFIPSANAHMEVYSYKELARDRTFSRAVGYVVESCLVDDETIMC